MQSSVVVALFSSLLILPSVIAAGQAANTGQPPSIDVGQTSSVNTATLTFTAPTVAETPFTINVLTQGSPNLDYKLASGGTCSTTATYAVGDTCTVLYTFSPRYPGVRYGGVSLTVGTTVLANTYLSGTGAGPEAAIGPPIQHTLGGGLSYPGVTFAIDGAGDIYLAEFFSTSFQSGALVKIPNGCSDASCVVTLASMSDFGNPGAPTAVAIDGTGNLYVAFYSTTLSNSGVYKLPQGCFARACSQQLGGGFLGPLAIAFDQDVTGNVYVASRFNSTSILKSNSSIWEIPPGCTSESCVVSLSQPFEDGAINSVTLDDSGDVYFGGSSPANSSLQAGTYEIPAGCTSSSCNIYYARAGGSYSSSGVDSNGILYVATYTSVFYNGYQYFEPVYGFPKGCFDVSCARAIPAGTFQYYLPQKQLFNGNVYAVAPGGQSIVEYDFSSPAIVAFPATFQGQVSPAQTVTLTNEGNEPLVFAVPNAGANASASQYFNLSTSGSTDCPSLTPNSFSTASLAAATNCTYPISFAPEAPVQGTVNGTLTITDNSLNGTGSVQTVPLTGSVTSPIATSMTLLSSVNPASAGQSVTFTAQVSSGSGTPTGNITFTDGSVSLGTVAVNTSGTATVTVPNLTPGAHTIGASFLSNPVGQYASSGESLTEVVNYAFSTTTLAVTPTSIDIGGSVTLTATVAGSVMTPNGTIGPTGTVTFYDNGTLLTTATTVNGVASATNSTLPTGNDLITCTYSGDTYFDPSICSNPQTVSILMAATTMSLASSLNPASAGQSVTFTARVSSASGTPTGSVTFTDGSAPLDTVIVNTVGIATVTVPSLTPGTHIIGASFLSNPVGQYTSSNATLTEVVNFAPSTTTLTVAPTSADLGASVTLTATVSGSVMAPNGSIPPTGTVTFYDNGVQLTTAMITNGIASTANSAFQVGNDLVTCAYSGDANFAPSTCDDPQTVSVQSPDFSIAADPTALQLRASNTVSIALTVTSTGGFDGIVNLTCGTSLPKGFSCSFIPMSVAVPTGGSVHSTLTISTAYNSVATNLHGFEPIGQIASALALPFALLLLRRRKTAVRILLVFASVWLVSVATGCGGGYALGVMPGTYTIPIVASSNGITHTLNYQVTVTP